MKSNPDRLALILRRRDAGDTMQSIATDLGVTRQRVHKLEHLARRDLLVTIAARQPRQEANGHAQ